nr:reverse transcriptase domain-containing protein [Tanacetum cinerariifolium]
MCREGIVLGHKISKSGIEVDRAKVDAIAKLPHPTIVKGVRSFLGHADIANFHTGNFIKMGLTTQQKKKFFKDEAFEILKAFHKGPSRGHHSANLTAKMGKISQRDEMPQNTVDYLSKWIEAKVLPPTML